MLPAVSTALNWCILFYLELVPYQPNFCLNMLGQKTWSGGTISRDPAGDQETRLYRVLGCLQKLNCML